MPIPGAENELYFATGIDNTGLKRGKTQAIGIIRGMASQISKEDVFGGLALGATLAFSKISKEMKQFSAEFEHSMREVQTISKAVEADFEGFASGIVELSTGVPQSALELSAAFYQIVSAGYDGAEGMNLLEVSAQAAVGGVTDVATAADGLTSVMNAWKISSDQATRVSDTFFNTVKLGKTTMGELASNIAKVAPLAAAYGVSFEEIASAVATLTKQGTPTSEAMTQIRASLIAVNDKLGEGWASTRTFQEALIEVAEGAKSSGKDLQSYVGTVEAVMAILATTGDNAKIASEDLRSFAEAAGLSEAAFNRLIDDSVNQSKTLANNIKAALSPLGDFLNDKSTDFAKKLNEAFKTGDVEKFAKILAVAVTSMTAYTIATKAATLSKMQYLRAIVKVKNAMVSLNVATKANPIGLVVAGLTAATAAFVAFRKRANEATKEFKDFLGERTRAIMELDELFKVVEKTAEGTKAHADAIKTVNDRYGDYLPNLLDEKSSLEDIKKAHEEAKKAMMDRMAAAAMSSALEAERTKFIERQSKIHGELYDKVSRISSIDVASLAATDFEAMIDKYREIGEQVQRAQRAGLTDLGTKLQDDIRNMIDNFANTYLGGDSKFANELVLDVVFNENDLRIAEQRVKALYGDVQSISEEVQKEVTSDSGDGLDIFNREAFQKEIDEAKDAYSDWEKFKETTRANDLKGEYSAYLDQASSYKEYLELKLQAYAHNKEAISLILKELATLEAQAMSRAKKEVDDFVDTYMDLVQENTDGILAMMEEGTEALKGQTTESLKNFNDEIKSALEDINRTKLKYASNKEILDMQLKEWEDYYKKARLPMDEDYYRIRNKIIAEFNAAEIREFQAGLRKISTSMVELFREIDDEAAEVLGNVAELADHVLEGIGSYYSGDWAGTVASIIGGISEVYQLIKNALDKQEKLNLEAKEEAYEVINREIEKANDLLREQISLLDQLSGMDWLTGARQSINSLESDMQSVLKAMRDMQLLDPTQPSRSVDSDVDTSNWGVEDFQEWARKYAGQFEGEETLLNYIELYNSYLDERNRLIEERNAEITGTTTDAIVDSLRQSLLAGEDMIQSFAQTFEDLMKNAVMQGFSIRYIEPFVDEFYNMMLGYLDPTKVEAYLGIPGQITSSENEALQRFWEEGLASIPDPQEIFPWLNWSSDSSDANSLSGSIQRSITEETGTLVAGRMNNMMLTMAEMLEIQTGMSESLEEIRTNTRYNKHLSEVRDTLNRIDQKL